MGIKISIAATQVLVSYLAVLYFTDFSLVGFWTDIICVLLLTVSSFLLAFNGRIEKSFGVLLWRLLNMALAVGVMGYLGMKLFDPITWDTFKLRSFYYQEVDGRLFNAYFKPVGAYAGGEGNLWITETPTMFPIMERQVYYKAGVLHDFASDTFDGQPIDNYAAIRGVIENEVIR